MEWVIRLGRLQVTVLCLDDSKNSVGREGLLVYLLAVDGLDSQLVLY